MSDARLDLGEPGNCPSCSKARDHVIGESCIDCLVYYGSATPDQITAHEYALELYRRGFENGRLDALAVGSLPAEGQK